MTTVAVLGGGAGACAAAVELTSNGHRVRIWNRRAATIEALMAGGALTYSGVLGSGELVPDLVTTDLAAALHDADVAVVCQPALAHEAVFDELARLKSALPLVLNPGHTAGALHARAVFAARSCPLPPVAELSTLTYVARKPAGDEVVVYGRAGRVHVAALPGGDAALRYAAELFAAAEPEHDVLAASLANVNLVLHPPGAILAAAWVEATGGDFTFYVQGMTGAVLRVIESLDSERLEVARAFGHDLPPLLDEMAAVGTVEGGNSGWAEAGTAIRGGQANSQIRAPDSLTHRYYQEDFPYGLVPFIALARIAGTPVPVAEALLRLGEIATDTRFGERGLTARRLGLDGCTVESLRQIVRRERASLLADVLARRDGPTVE